MGNETHAIIHLQCYTYQFPDSVENKVDLFLSNSVVPTSIIISGVLLAAYQLLGVK